MKCGEIFCSNDVKFTLICAFCNSSFKDMHEFGEHILENHYGKPAKDTNDLVDEKPSSSIVKFETVFIETNKTNDDSESDDNFQYEDYIESDAEMVEPKNIISKEDETESVQTIENMKYTLLDVDISKFLSPSNDKKIEFFETKENQEINTRTNPEIAENSLSDNKGIDGTSETKIEIIGEPKRSNKLTRSEMNKVIQGLTSALAKTKDNHKTIILPSNDDKMVEIFEPDFQILNENQNKTKNLNLELTKVIKNLTNTLSDSKIKLTPSSGVITENKKTKFDDEYECQYCKKKFKDKSICEHHERTHSNETLFQCRHCCKYLSSQTKLKTHILGHTGGRPFKCDECLTSFKTKDGLTRHMLCHSGKWPLKCTVCKKGFRDRTELMIHMRCHTGEKPYQCDECGINYRTSGQLRDHKKRHANIRDYVCDICKKAFFTKRHLRNHSTIHTDERPFHCEICLQSFRLDVTLASHLKTHRNKNDNPSGLTMKRRYISGTVHCCTICDKSFPYYISLHSHMKVHKNDPPLLTEENSTEKN